MFFYAAKLVWFFLQPSAALILGLAAGVLAIGLGAVRLGAGLILLATIGLVVAGFSPLGAALMLPLENRFARVEPEGPVTGILVLGGGIDQRIGEARQTPTLTESGDRLTEAVALALRYPEARLVFTGGSDQFVPDGPSEGEAARRFFLSMGIPDSRITIEDRSRDTAENARFSKALIDPKPGERWLMVTSAFHMPRSMGCFQVVGWDVLPWPADYRTSGPADLTRFVSQPSVGLQRVDVATKEWIGLVAYRLSGRTEALFPGPVLTR